MNAGTRDKLTDAAPVAARARPLWIRCLPICAIAAGLLLFFVLGFGDYLSFDMLSRHQHDLMAWTEAHYLLAVACFMGLYALAITFSVPGGVWLTLAGGFLFGAIAATVYVVVAATAGALTIFLAARYAFADLLRARTGGAGERMKQGFEENAFNYLLVLRLVPLFPFWLVNLVPAFMKVPVRTYLLATFIGIIPGTFVYAGVGSGLGMVFEKGEMPDLGIIFEPEILLPILGLAVLSLVPVIYHKVKARSGG